MELSRTPLHLGLLPSAPLASLLQPLLWLLIILVQITCNDMCIAVHLMRCREEVQWDAKFSRPVACCPTFLLSSLDSVGQGASLSFFSCPTHLTKVHVFLSLFARTLHYICLHCKCLHYARIHSYTCTFTLYRRSAYLAESSSAPFVQGDAGLTSDIISTHTFGSMLGPKRPCQCVNTWVPFFLLQNS